MGEFIGNHLGVYVGLVGEPHAFVWRVNNNNNNNGYLKVLFHRRAHSHFNKKNSNGVNIELGKTNRLKALCMMQINI